MVVTVTRVETDVWEDHDLQNDIQDLTGELVARGRESTNRTAAQEVLLEGIAELRENPLISFDQFARAGIAIHIGYLMRGHLQALPELEARGYMRSGIPLGELEMVRRARQRYEALCRKPDCLDAFAGSLCFRARFQQKAAIGSFHRKIAVVSPDTHPADVVLLDTYGTSRLTTRH